MTAQTDELAKLFAGLSPKGKAAVLARIAHMETIHVRAAYHNAQPDVDAMVRSNELIHRLSGYSLRVLSQPVEPDQDRSMIDMILASISPARQQAVAELNAWMQEATAL